MALVDGESLPCAPHYDPGPAVIGAATNRGSKVRVTRDAAKAVQGVDIVVTDTWISMGHKHAEAKLTAMMLYQVTTALMTEAKPNATFLQARTASAYWSDRYFLKLPFS